MEIKSEIKLSILQIEQQAKDDCAVLLALARYSVKYSVVNTDSHTQYYQKAD